ncbi:MAG: transcription antitermination factor NusB [Hyphomicrobiaceae bacterium]
MTMRPKAQPGKSARSLARIAAVQALYQMDMAGTALNDVIREFETMRFASKKPDNDAKMERSPAGKGASSSAISGAADRQFFADILRGVVRLQRDIDPAIDEQLASGWRLVRVDSILRASLRGGVFELLERRDVPARVVINEYIDVAHAFFDGDEPKVVNGVLDRLARRFRPDEFAQPATGAADS